MSMDSYYGLGRLIGQSRDTQYLVDREAYLQRQAAGYYPIQQRLPEEEPKEKKDNPDNLLLLLEYI